MPVLFAEHINYNAQGKAILRDISLEVKSGERFALLGHNGSGKSTLIEIMTGVVAHDTGKTGFAGGVDFSEVKAKTGVLWDNLNFFPLLKVKEVIRLIAQLYNRKPEAYHEVYDCLEIQTIQHQYMEKLSRGEKKRVEILLTVMHNPALLILDEPTAELDPLMREKVWRNIFLKAETIFFTTHLWEEAKKFATSIAFIYKGALLNKPASYHELITSCGFTNKIITTKEVPLELAGIPAYETEKEKVILVNQGSELIEQVRKATINYSVMPIELEDIYRYLIIEKG